MRNNIFIAIGRVKSDAQTRTNSNGTEFTTFSIIVSDLEVISGEPSEVNETFDFLAYGNTAITAKKIAKRGQSLTVNAHIKSFVDANQNKRYLFIADSVGLNIISHIDKSVIS